MGFRAPSLAGARPPRITTEPCGRITANRSLGYLLAAKWAGRFDLADGPRFDLTRAAHALALANDKGLASTEDLRQAFVHYRSLFAELLGTQQDGHREEAQ